MRRFLRNNGLSLVLFGLFVLSFGGQALAGWRHYNQEQESHHRPQVGLVKYLQTGDFLEATFENWESEFLQMAAFLVLSAMLVQRGSAESKKPPEEEEDQGADEEVKPDSPAPVHRGGLALRLYSHSLSLALTLLFVISFALHALTGVRKYNDEQRAHGEPTVTTWQYLRSSTFWFESFQNWQSEFMSVGALVVLSIFLRQKGSPESKPVQAAHAQTGT